MPCSVSAVSLRDLAYCEVCLTWFWKGIDLPNEGFEA